MILVSDFKIAAAICREMCKAQGKPFADVAIVFDEPAGKLSNNNLSIGKTVNIAHTTYQIVQSYFLNDKQILGESIFSEQSKRDDFLIFAASIIRKVFLYNPQASDEIADNESFCQRLYQRTFVWTLLKNVILPLYSKPIKNIKLICGNNPTTDAAKLFDGLVANLFEDEEYKKVIYVNEGVQNEVTKDAFILCEAIKFHGLSPTEVFTDIFSGNLYEKVLGTAKLAYKNNERVEEFVEILFAICALDARLFPHAEKGAGKIVAAQSNWPMTVPMQWWWMGLIEKMLAPVRGPDWTTHEMLKDHAEDFWDQVKLIKSRKNQGDGVSFNDLLRLKQIQVSDPTDTSQTIQSLLSSQRIW